MLLHRALWLAMALLFAPLGHTQPGGRSPLIVFAAASLTEPLIEIGRHYTQLSGFEIEFSFAASSTLARQIGSGANPQIFVSANRLWMDVLDRQGLLVAASRHTILANTLVLVSNTETLLKPFKLTNETNLPALLKAGERIAIGDPDHVPVGIYTMHSLTRLGLWQDIESLLARTDNTRATVALIERGEAPIGFVYLSDAGMSPSIKVLAEVPPDPANRIEYELAMINNPSPQASEFIRFLDGKRAHEIFSNYRFIPLSK